MRFTVRDLFWLTVVVALALGWGISAAHWARRQQVTARHAEALRTPLDHAEQNIDAQRKLPGIDYDPKEGLLPVDWELATREIP